LDIGVLRVSSKDIVIADYLHVQGTTIGDLRIYHSGSEEMDIDSYVLGF
jgi:hypothetical protein